MLSKEVYNILASLSPEDYKDIRKIIISCILATDMKEHFDELKNLKLLTEGLKQMAGSESPHRAKSYSKKKFPGGEKKPEDSNGDSGLGNLTLTTIEVIITWLFSKKNGLRMT